MKNRHFTFSVTLILVLATASVLTSGEERTFPWQDEFKNPLDEYRIFHMWHGFGTNYESAI